MEEDSTLTSYVLLDNGNGYYINDVAIDDKFPDSGIGDILMDAADDRCIELGLKRFSLLVFELNTDAKRIHDRLGYEDIDGAADLPHKLIYFTGKMGLMLWAAIISITSNGQSSE